MAKRNEPCPCGSGKKFKKCCLAKYEKENFNQNKKIVNVIHEVSPNFEIQENGLIAFTVGFNFVFFAEAIYFEEMEIVILEEIPDSFTQELLELFQDTPFSLKFLVSSFVRSSDFIYDYNDEDIIEIINLAKKHKLKDSIKKGTVIPFALSKLLYKQKTLAKSRSKDILETIKYAKEIGADGDMIQYKTHEYYTLRGVMFIEEENINEFKFLKSIYSKKTRKVITQNTETLCKILSDKAGFEITPIFLDFSLDLDGIIKEIYAFSHYCDNKKIYRPSDVREYSLYKKKRRFFGLF